jgi:protein involved in polysaccharide export with SLBB domain
VLIGGQVAHPGYYDVKSTGGVPGLIALAGGPTREEATTRVLVERGVAPDTKALTLDVFAAVRQGGTEPDFALRDGDFVIVPRSLNRVWVVGQVKVPSHFVIPEHDTLSIAEAI